MIPHLLLRNSAIGSDRNLCFTNAAVQVLRNVMPFREKCNEYSDISETHKILKQILEYEGTDYSVSAHPLRKKIGELTGRRDFYSGEQNDALEFCDYLLENLHPSISSLFR